MVNGMPQFHLILVLSHGQDAQLSISPRTQGQWGTAMNGEVRERVPKPRGASQLLAQILDRQVGFI